MTENPAALMGQPVSLEEITEAEAQRLVIENELPLEELRKTLLALDSAYREPLVMQVLLGLTTQEIARRLLSFPLKSRACCALWSSWKLARAHRTML